MPSGSRVPWQGLRAAAFRGKYCVSLTVSEGGARGRILSAFEICAAWDCAAAQSAKGLVDQMVAFLNLS